MSPAPVAGLDPNCDFCGILLAQEPARIVWQTADVTAFFPTSPATLGHTLLIPAVHVSHLWQLEEDCAAQLGAACVQISRAIHTTFSPAGMNVIQSNGEIATQTVPHVHFHIVPRYRADDLALAWPDDQQWTASEMDAACSALQTATKSDRL